MSPKYSLRVALGVGALFLIFVAAVQAQMTPHQKQATAAPKAAQVHSEGERIFAQNCSRCHTAPDGFSPRISGTVVRHMRVRAQLSRHDEEELLRFFNP